MTFSHQKTSPWCSQTGHALLSDLHFFVSLFQLIFFFFFYFLYSAVWFGLQRAAGKSQWRCRPKQPGLKWLCECSVRDSFRACGKPAHSLLTVAMRERVRRRKVEEREIIYTDRKFAGVWEIKGTCRYKIRFRSLVLSFICSSIHPISMSFTFSQLPGTSYNTVKLNSGNLLVCILWNCHSVLVQPPYVTYDSVKVISKWGRR